MRLGMRPRLGKRHIKRLTRIAAHELGQEHRPPGSVGVGDPACLEQRQDELDTGRPEDVPGLGHQVVTPGHLPGLPGGEGLAESPHGVEQIALLVGNPGCSPVVTGNPS